MARIEVRIRRPEPWERRVVVDWVNRVFSSGWSAECEAAFSVRPPSCFIAVERGQIVGFACFDCTRRNFFGPTGVTEPARGRGIGAALLLACLYAMREAGYAYAIIGGAGPSEFYVRTVGAMPIEGSTPGIYDFTLAQGAKRGDG